MTEKKVTCNNAIEAEALWTALQEGGIESTIYDETNSKVARGILDQSIDVIVKEEDYCQAQKIYDTLLAEKQSFMPWCPKCGSEKVSAQTKKNLNTRQLPRILATLLMFIPFGNATIQKFVCNDCGYKWER